MPIAAPLEVPFAGLLIDLASAAVALLAGISGLLGGAAHYLAVLTAQPQRQVEVRTGTGFFVGMAIGLGFLLVDFIV